MDDLPKKIDWDALNVYGNSFAVDCFICENPFPVNPDNMPNPAICEDCRAALKTVVMSIRNPPL